MGKKLLISTALFFCLVIGVSAERMEFGAYDLNVTVLESNDFRTVVEYEIGAFDKESIEINGELYYQISLGSEHILNTAGEPALLFTVSLYSFFLFTE